MPQTGLHAPPVQPAALSLRATHPRRHRRGHLPLHRLEAAEPPSRDRHLPAPHRGLALLPVPHIDRVRAARLASPVLRDPRRPPDPRALAPGNCASHGTREAAHDVTGARRRSRPHRAGGKQLYWTAVAAVGGDHNGPGRPRGGADGVFADQGCGDGDCAAEEPVNVQEVPVLVREGSMGGCRYECARREAEGRQVFACVSSAGVLLFCFSRSGYWLSVWVEREQHCGVEIITLKVGIVLSQSRAITRQEKKGNKK